MDRPVTCLDAPPPIHHSPRTGAGDFPLDFALIGHQESWQAAADVLSVLRGPRHPPLPLREVCEILPWIPARTICHVEVHSTLGASSPGMNSARGIYIDSFIPPDRLDAASTHDNLARVRAAATCAIRAGAGIISLGGFSSILIEGNFNQLPDRRHSCFTSGNTLTVSLIVRGLEQLCTLQNRDLSRSTLLIVGATGDVGSGCARCLAPRVRRVLLYARNPERLRRVASELRSAGAAVEVATGAEPFTRKANLVICAASLASPAAAPVLHSRITPDAILCDAGYPKNLCPDFTGHGTTVFFGGLGQVTGGMCFTPDLQGILNRHPFPNVAHGCLLEGMALALERRLEPYSRGRGYITPTRVAEIEAIAIRHGIHLAPLHNADGPLELNTSQHQFS